MLSYHAQPPFVVAPSTGLTFDLASYLGGRLSANVTTEIVPRNRLEAEALVAIPPTIVPWVSPTWFSAEYLEKVAFSPPLLAGENIVISSAKGRIEYEGPSSLIGYRMGIVTGRIHKDIDQLVNEGKIKVSTARTPTLNLEMLLAGRVDFVIMPRATWVALVPKEQRHLYYVSRRPQETFNRHLMLARGASLMHEVEILVPAMLSDPDWLAICEKYGLDEPVFRAMPT